MDLYMNVPQDARNPEELEANVPSNNQDDEVQILSPYIISGNIREGMAESAAMPLAGQAIPYLQIDRNIVFGEGDAIGENFEQPIIPQIDLSDTVADIEIIENVENIANVVEVEAINDNPQAIGGEDGGERILALEEIEIPVIPPRYLEGAYPIVLATTSSTTDPVPLIRESEDKPRKKRKLEETKIQTQESEENDNDEGRVCPICLEPWTNSGEHRLCSLACGHLFGHKCILRWLKHECTSQNRRCPHCNTKAQTKDIRMIYTTNLTAVDTIEFDRLKNELQNVIAKKKNLESELSTSQLRCKIAQDHAKSLSEKIEFLKVQSAEFMRELKERSRDPIEGIVRKLHLEKTLEIAKDGGCRVIDYNSWYNYVVVSQKSTNLFPGYGIKRIDINKYEQMPLILAHNQVIRDMSFHKSQQSLLMSVGFDKTAKMIDIHNNQVVHTYSVDSQAWSCCWVGDNPNMFVVGTQKRITQFDIRSTSGPVQTFDNPEDRSPIVSLAPVPAASSDGMLRGGFLAAHLNSCFAYETKADSYIAKRIDYTGPFLSVRYDPESHHALLSARPNFTNPQTRHIVFSIERGTEEEIVCNTAQTFLGGNTQNLLSRSCQINVTNDTYIAAYREATKSIPIWSISSGKEIQNISATDPVIDMCSFRLQNIVVLGTLSFNKLRIYHCEQP